MDGRVNWCLGWRLGWLVARADLLARATDIFTLLAENRRRPGSSLNPALSVQGPPAPVTAPNRVATETSKITNLFGGGRVCR